MSDAENLARLRVAVATGQLPADVGRWALLLCQAGTSAGERREQRNHYLRQAAAVHGGTRWAAAREIHAQLQLLRRRGTTQPGNPFQQLVHEAWRTDPERPRTLRRILSVLE